MLKKLSVHHDLWIKMLLNLGCEMSLAEDLVQDMYIRLHDLVKDESRVMYGEDINKYFVYITIRNLYYQHLKVSNRYDFCEFVDDNSEVEAEYNYERDYAADNLLESIKDVVSTWNVYNKKLFELYFGIRITKNDVKLTKGKSLREIAKGSGISAGSVFHSIKNFKILLNDELGDEFEGYFSKI